MRFIFLLSLVFASVASQAVSRNFPDGLAFMSVVSTKTGVFTIDRDPPLVEGETTSNNIFTRCFPAGYKRGDPYPPILGQKSYYNQIPSKYAAHCKVGDTINIQSFGTDVDRLPKNTTFTIEEVESSAISTVQYGTYNNTDSQGKVVRLNATRSDGLRSFAAMQLPSGAAIAEPVVNLFSIGLYPPIIDDYDILYVPANTSVRFYSPDFGYKVMKLGDSVFALTNDFLTVSREEVGLGDCVVFKNSTSGKSLKYICSSLYIGIIPTSPIYASTSNGTVSVQSVPLLRLSADQKVSRGDPDVESTQSAVIGKDENAVLVTYIVDGVPKGSYFVEKQDSPQFFIDYPVGTVEVETTSATLYKVSLSGADVYREYSETKPVGGQVWIQLTSQQDAFISLSSNTSLGLFTEKDSIPNGEPESSVRAIFAGVPLYVRFKGGPLAVNTYLNITYVQNFVDVNLATDQDVSLNNTEEVSVVRFQTLSSDRCFDLITTSTIPVSNPFFSVIESKLTSNTYTICKTNTSTTQNTFPYVASASFVGNITALRAKVQNVQCGETVMFANDSSPIILSLPDTFYSITIISPSVTNLDWSNTQGTLGSDNQIILTLTEVRVQPLLRFLQTGGNFTIPSTCRSANEQPSCASNSQCPSGSCLPSGKCEPVTLPPTSENQSNQSNQPNNPQTSQIRVNSSLKIASSLLLVLVAVFLC